MGVNGDVLKRILKCAGRPMNLSKYSNGIDDNSRSGSGKRRKLRPVRIGVDVSSWIARASHGHGTMLIDDRHMTNYGRARLELGEETELDQLTSEENQRNYVETCAKKVLSQILALNSKSKGNLLIVLDGSSPPIKKQEKLRRSNRKRKAREEVEEKETAFDRRLRAARVAGAGSAYPLIVAELLQLLRENELAFLVSPYEADGELAYLAKRGIIDLVITEDSDLLCQDIQTLVFKYNDETGAGVMLRRCDLGAMELQSRTLSLLDFSTTMVAIMFVCVGCDYCDSLYGIGPVTARDIVQKVFQALPTSSTPVLRSIFDELYDVSKSSLTDSEKEQYEDRFMAALFQYQHPIIFCPFQRKCILANNPPHNTDPILLDYEPFEKLCHDPGKQHELVGSFPEARFQIAIAEGWIDPRTLRAYPNQALPSYVKEFLPQHHKSIGNSSDSMLEWRRPSDESQRQEGQCRTEDEADDDFDTQEELRVESQEAQNVRKVEAQGDRGTEEDIADGNESDTQGEQAAAEDPRETPPDARMDLSSAWHATHVPHMTAATTPTLTIFATQQRSGSFSETCSIGVAGCQPPSHAGLAHHSEIIKHTQEFIDMPGDAVAEFDSRSRPTLGRLRTDCSLNRSQQDEGRSPHGSTQSSRTTLGSTTMRNMMATASSQDESVGRSPNQQSSTQSSRSTEGMSSSSSSKPATQQSSQASSCLMSPPLLP